eukprot:313202-Prorocentrum_minimum.AAC.1
MGSEEISKEEEKGAPVKTIPAAKPPKPPPTIPEQNDIELGQDDRAARLARARKAIETEVSSTGTRFGSMSSRRGTNRKVMDQSEAPSDWKFVSPTYGEEGNKSMGRTVMFAFIAGLGMLLLAWVVTQVAVPMYAEYWHVQLPTKGTSTDPNAPSRSTSTQEKSQAGTMPAQGEMEHSDAELEKLMLESKEPDVHEEEELLFDEDFTGEPEAEDNDSSPIADDDSSEASPDAGEQTEQTERTEGEASEEGTGGDASESPEEGRDERDEGGTTTGDNAVEQAEEPEEPNEPREGEESENPFDDEQAKENARIEAKARLDKMMELFKPKYDESRLYGRDSSPVERGELSKAPPVKEAPVKICNAAHTPLGSLTRYITPHSLPLESSVLPPVIGGVPPETGGAVRSGGHRWGNGADIKPPSRVTLPLESSVLSPLFCERFQGFTEADATRDPITYRNACETATLLRESGSGNGSGAPIRLLCLIGPIMRIYPPPARASCVRLVHREKSCACFRENVFDVSQVIAADLSHLRRRV